MTVSGEPSLTEVAFEELESVDQYEATFTGTLDGEELTLTYALESAVGADDQTVYTPGDSELDRVVVRPDTYEFETDDRETVRFTATDDDGEDLFAVYAFTEAEDADENEVGLTVDPDA
jgi:hypothetical protein